MADEIKKEDLEKEIEKILKVSDLQKISMKNLRQQLEKKLGVSLKSWSSAISKYAMEYMDKLEEEREDDDEVKEESSQSAASGSGDESEEEVKKKPAPRGRKRKTSGDSDYVEEKPKKGRKKGEGGEKAKGKGRNTGYTRAYRLSPALSELMGGAEEMPRHEVVKRVWAIIKEKNLYDQSNKQFAICDDALYKVIGTKRFRTFGMMKYLKTHFLDD